MTTTWQATIHETPERVVTAPTKRELLDKLGVWSATKSTTGYVVYGGGGDPDITIRRITH